MKKFLAHDTMQAVINIMLACIILATLMICFIVGSSDAFVWMYIIAMISTVMFLVYNSWVSSYLNRDR